MTENDLDNLDISLQKWRQLRKTIGKVNELVRLSTAKGHSDGRWQPTLNINYQVAYQQNVGGTNYHSCEELNREIHKLISNDLPSYLEKAIANLKQDYEDSKKIHIKETNEIS